MTQTPSSLVAHQAAARVAVPANFAFEKLANAGFVGGWALGSMGLQAVADGVFRGQSLFDGSSAHVEIRPHPDQGLIDFHVGTAQSRKPRIFIRITDGAGLGFDSGACLVTMHALRANDAAEDTWARTCVSHEAEILLIKSQLESAWAAARGRA
ncbi:MAG: hypothetical protein HLUCCA12_14300 [Rhodobacteraceae bacterium HLUCCA12]|nr:MAG: hypothetical protein HLUCCA12_14300 [Rhodobacteraceae bacterium HLUCCA12]